MTKSRLLAGLILILCATSYGKDGFLFGARDESPAPFPEATINDFREYASFGEAIRSPSKFPARFFLVDAEGTPIPDLDGMGGIFRTRYVAKTLSGARTLVFIRLKTSQAGEWVTVFTKEKQGAATAIVIEACCIDMANPSVRTVIKGDSLPLPGVSREAFRWKSADGTVNRTGQYRPGQLLQELLEDVIR